MSSLQRTPHLTGLNNDFPNQFPEAGSYYVPQAGGAPGVLSGPASGFTIAFGLYLPIGAGETGLVANFEPDVPVLGAPPYDQRGGEFEYIMGTDETVGGLQGWFVNGLSGDSVSVSIGDAVVTSFSDIGRPDLIVLASFMADGSAFGLANPVMAMNVNGVPLDNDELTAPYVPINQFQLGGFGGALAQSEAPNGELVGMLNSQLNSFWITTGIPDLEQVQEFMDLSMQAGQVIPQPWAVGRTASAPNPTTPDSPTGHHWSVNDLDLSQGIGGTWTDRIGGIVLERIGSLNSTARELGRQGSYFPMSVAG